MSEINKQANTHKKLKRKKQQATKAYRHELGNLLIQDIIQFIHLVLGKGLELWEIDFAELGSKGLDVRKISRGQIVFLENGAKDIGEIVDEL